MGPPAAEFQVPDAVARRREDASSPTSVQERFRADHMAAALRERAAFGAVETETARDILLEAAPLLVAKKLVVPDDTMDPKMWHACAAFVAAGCARDASTSRSYATKDDASRTLTNLLRVFDVNAADFFRGLRKFMMASSSALSARVGRGAGERRRSSGGGDARAAPVDAPANAGESLNELEAALSISELRTSFAFTQVVAQKYRLFFDVHFDKSRPGGAALARFGWRLFLAAKRAALPRFPDLYSCYHLLVVVQAFMLVNAPASLLRTDLRNMVSMSARDVDGNVDALASLSANAKTKLPALRDALATFQKETVRGALATHLAAAREETKSPGRGARSPRAGGKLEPAASPGPGVSPDGPSRFPGLLPEGEDPAAALETAAKAASAAYDAACANLPPHLRLDERLYLALDAEEEAEALRVLGDVSKPARPGGSGGVAATPGPGLGHVGAAATPWRGAGTMRGILGPSPARLGSKAAYSPYSTRNPGEGPGLGSGGSFVPFTPISEAMASAAWLHTIVSSSSSSSAAPGGTPRGKKNPDPVERLARFVRVEVAEKLMKSVHALAGKTSAALREDAFLVTINGVAALAGAGHNVSLDNLVKRRQEEAVRVFAYFMELILEGEHRRLTGGGAGAGSGLGSGLGGGSLPGGSLPGGSVADIAALAAETAEPAPAVFSAPDASQRAGYETLLGSSRLVRSVLACSMEVVVASYKTATLKFPAIPRLLGLDAFDVSSIIEPFVRADTTMPREVKKHFNAIEERIMETMAWSKGSSLFGYMRAAESGAPPPRPAAAALAAVNGARDAKAADTDANTEATKMHMRREPSFSVAGVAAAAADSPGGTEETDPREDGILDASGGERRAVAAFSTPLRGAVTPSRNPRTSSGGVGPLSTSGAEPEPLPKRFVREPAVDPDTGKPLGDVAARNSLRVFFAKTMRVSARRLADLCERLQLPPALTRQAYELVQHALYDRTSLLYNRHLDQILLCATYGVCKVNKDGALRGRLVAFRDVIYHYEKQPQCREEVFWTVILSQTDPELQPRRQGDIIEFYNETFVPEMKTFLLALKPGGSAANPGGSNLANNHQSGAEDVAPFRSGSGALAADGVGAEDPTRALPAGLQSPRKMLGAAKANVYVSPMRGDKASASHAAVTPRSKSLFAFVGESTHAYQSPGRDLHFINRRVAASANHESGAAVGVAAAAAAAAAARGGTAGATGAAGAAPPPVGGNGKAARHLPFGDADEARPPKVPRR